MLRHDELGLTLHPFDLATNKVLALVGRLEVRDWVDVIESHERIQPLGYLAWAACGKDPGFSPGSILEHATRSGRYTSEEVGGLAFSSQPPDAASLSRKWKRMLADASEIITLLPPEEVGKCVLDSSSRLFAKGIGELRPAIVSGGLIFHPGRIRGAMPVLKE